MRLAAALPLAVLLLLPIPGCGSEAPVIRVQVETAPADGAVDVDLALVHAGPDRTRYPLRPVAGAAPGVMEAEAPSGHYFLQSAPGWDQLRVKPDAFYFQADRDLAPQSVYVGKAGTFYVSMRDQDLPAVSREWVLERVHGDGRRSPVEAEVFQAFDKVVGIRPPRREWRGRLRLIGRRVDGRLLNPMEVDLGEPGPDRPRVRLMITAPTAELGVRLVAPAGAAGVPDGYPARVRVRGIPLASAQEARAEDGVVAFPLVPYLPEGVAVEAGGVAYALSKAFLDTYGVVHLLALTEPLTAVWELTWPDGGRIDEVRVRPSGRRQYARALVLPVGDEGAARVRVTTCVGPQRWLVRSGRRFAEVEVAPTADASAGTVAIPAWTVGGTATGEVRDARQGPPRPLGPGHRLLFVRTEGKAEVLGEGLDLVVPTVGRYEVTLPPGRYTVRVQGPRGLVGAPQVLEVAAGVSLRRSFELE